MDPDSRALVKTSYDSRSQNPYFDILRSDVARAGRTLACEESFERIFSTVHSALLLSDNTAKYNKLLLAKERRRKERCACKKVYAQMRALRLYIV